VEVIEMVQLRTQPDGQAWTTVVQCFGRCRGPRGGQKRTPHVVRSVLLNGHPFTETMCVECGDVSFTDAETAAVRHLEDVIDIE
jgi:hypothetical protein